MSKILFIVDRSLFMLSKGWIRAGKQKLEDGDDMWVQHYPGGAKWYVGPILPIDSINDKGEFVNPTDSNAAEWTLIGALDAAFCAEFNIIYDLQPPKRRNISPSQERLMGLRFAFQNDIWKPANREHLPLEIQEETDGGSDQLNWFNEHEDTDQKKVLDSMNRAKRYIQKR